MGETTSTITCAACVGGSCHRCNPREYLACPVCGTHGTGGGPDGTCLACRGAGSLVRDVAVCHADAGECGVCGVVGRVALIELDDIHDRRVPLARLCVPCLAFALGEALS